MRKDHTKRDRDYLIMLKAQKAPGKRLLIEEEIWIRGMPNMPDWRREEITRKYNDPRDR